MGRYQHRMPFIARWPGKTPAGSVSDQTIDFADVLATLAEIVELEKIPTGMAEDSVSFLPDLIDPSKSIERRAPILHNKWTLRDGDWKLIKGLGSGGFSKPSRVKSGEGDPAGQLYNLAEDRGESTNLYPRHPDIVRQLLAEMAKVVESGRSRPE